MKHYLGICLVLVTLAAIALFGIYSCTSAVNSTVDHVRDGFAQVLHLQPQVTVNQRVVLTQTAPIAELAVVTKEELVTLGLDEHLAILNVQIPLTQKKLTAECTYRIKAGFDLRQPVEVTIDSTTGKVRAKLPPAEILSVEAISPLKYEGDDAYLNHITDEERAKIVNDLTILARTAAENSSLKRDAEVQVTERLQQLIKHNGEPIAIDWGLSKAKEVLPPVTPIR